MLCNQFYCNTPTHQESVCIHISVVGRSHFVITPPPPPSQNLYVRPWAAVARIIVKGYLDLGYFPIMLSQAFFISAMFGEKAVSDDILIKSFKQYLAPIEEEVISKAFAADIEQDSDNEDLTCFNSFYLSDEITCRQ